MTPQQVLIAVLAIAALAVGSILLRKRQSSVARQPDINAEMPLLAHDAVAWAAEKDVALDFMPESVERVEGLLAGLHEKHGRNELPDDQVTRAAVRYGAYIGEVIRRMHSGSWAVDHEIAGPGSFPISYLEKQSFPIGWCGKRIINGEEDNVWFKFRIAVLGEGKDAMMISLEAGESD